MNYTVISTIENWALLIRYDIIARKDEFTVANIIADLKDKYADEHIPDYELRESVCSLITLLEADGLVKEYGKDPTGHTLYISTCR